jgi:SAM-dependent methyltransferase
MIFDESRAPSLRGLVDGVQLCMSALRGDRSARQRVIQRLVKSPYVFPYIDWPKKTEVTLASDEDLATTEVRAVDWRTHFTNRLIGHGLEIGPLHRPLPRSVEARVDYVDKLSVADLVKHYPELPVNDLTHPDIIDDGETLRTVPANRYDFVSAAHVIEHMRNPILALENWCRVVKPGGFVYLIVPDKRATFDRTRIRTSLEHLLLDYYQPSRERDREHYLDWSIRVNGNGGKPALEEAEHLENIDYSIHFHVFLPADVVALVEWFSKHVCRVEMVGGPAMAPGTDEFHLLLRKADAST